MNQIGELVLTPSRIYSRFVTGLHGGFDSDGTCVLHGVAHITGGGFAANLARVIPEDLSVRIDRSTWAPAPIFGLVGLLGDVALPELEKTLLDAYYALKGWDANGIPTKASLLDLDMACVAEDLEQRGILGKADATSEKAGEEAQVKEALSHA